MPLFSNLKKAQVTASGNNLSHVSAISSAHHSDDVIDQRAHVHVSRDGGRRREGVTGISNESATFCPLLPTFSPLITACLRQDQVEEESYHVQMNYSAWYICR